MREARTREASAWVAHAMPQHRLTERAVVEGSSDVLPALQSSDSESPRHMPRTEFIVEDSGAVQKDDGLRRARLVEGGALADSVLRHKTRTTAAKQHAAEAVPSQLRSAESQAPRLYASSVEVPHTTSTSEASGGAAELYRARRALAAAWVSDVMSVEESTAPVERSFDSVNERAIVSSQNDNPPSSSPQQHQPAQQQQQNAPSLRQTRLQVAGELIQSLVYSTPTTTEFNADASEHCLCSDAAMPTRREPLRASVSAASAKAQCAPRQPHRSGELYAARRALAQGIVDSTCKVDQKPEVPFESNTEGTPGSLRAARLLEAAVLVDTVM